MSTRESLLTAEAIRDLLEYDPCTGIFRWRIARSNCIKIGDVVGSDNQDASDAYLEHTRSKYGEFARRS